MARPKRVRKMTNPPHFKGFMPIGGVDDKQAVVLYYEEYEAVRLSDFLLLGQVDAAQLMGVSRPTYARIYESARRKVAQAFMLAKPIVFEGGKVYFDSEWYSCSSCGCWFNHPEKDREVLECALCGSEKVEQYTSDVTDMPLDDVCVCNICGYEVPHISGAACKKELCPHCKVFMERKGSNTMGRNKNHTCR